MPLYPSNGEIDLVRSYEHERIGLTGQNTVYYVINRSVNVDPLYGEPYSNGNRWSFSSYNLTMAIEFTEYSNRSPEASEDGFKIEFDAEAIVSYIEWNANIGAGSPPKESDVIECMGTHFDVVKVGKSGSLVDTSLNTGFKLELKRRSSFTPERRI